MAKVIVFGGINMDLFAYIPRSTREGETITASSIEFYLGGKGANQAVAASRLGAEVAFVGTVGKDEFGEKLIRMISSKKEKEKICRIWQEEIGKFTIVDNYGKNSYQRVTSKIGSNKACFDLDEGKWVMVDENYHFKN